MEPDDLAVFVGGSGSRTSMNFTTLCTSAHRIHSTGVFSGVNPLEFSVPLLLLQFGICAGTIILFHQLLKPLGQPLIVSQILVTFLFLLGKFSLNYMFSSWILVISDVLFVFGAKNSNEFLRKMKSMSRIEQK